MNTKNIMLAIWNQLTRKVAWRNIFVTHNAFGISVNIAKKKGSNNIVVFLTIQYYCLSLRHE